MANHIHITFEKLKKLWEPILQEYDGRSLLSDFNDSAKNSSYDSPENFPIFIEDENTILESFERWLGLQSQPPYIDSTNTDGTKFTSATKACEALKEFKNTIYFVWDRGEMYSAGQMFAAGFYNSKIQDKTLKMPNQVGGIAKNTLVGDLEGKRISQIFDMLLFPRILPTISTPQPTVSAKSSIAEIGTIFNKTSFNINANRGTIMLNGVQQNYARGEVSVNDGTFTNNGIIVRGTNTGTFVINYQQGPQAYDNYGDPYGSPVAVASFTKSANITGVHPCYSGIVSEISEASIKATSKSILANATGIVVGKQAFSRKYIVIAIPDYFSISQIINSSGLDETNVYSVRTDIMSGYKVYVSPIMDQPATYYITTK